MAGFLLGYRKMSLKPYDKPHLSYDDQVQLFVKRGLLVRDLKAAAEFLSRVSYYRLSAYRFPFLQQNDLFLPGTSFEQLTRLYKLDDALRQAFICALSPIEIYLRTRVTYQLTAKYGPFVQYDPSVFRSTFDHAKWVQAVEIEIVRGHETFLDHFKSKYSGFPRLPLWMAVEVMSFGSISKLYGGLLPDPQRSISSIFGIHHSVLHNWMHALTYVRNVCAHHSRLWNRELAIRPEIPRKAAEWQKIHIDNTRIFSIAAVVDWITTKALLPSPAIEKMFSVIDEIQKQGSRFPAFMGIPSDVQLRPLWK
ncbi:MAG TPA: Abi family protein [Chitinivibrionales bacterium]|nr:Abi family protein [Chitinivibrionales bacterium]